MQGVFFPLIIQGLKPSAYKYIRDLKFGAEATGNRLEI